MWPVLGSLGSIVIHTWGAMFALACLVALFVAMANARRKSIRPESVQNLVLVCIVGGLVGARALYVILEWQSYVGSVIAMLAVWDGGLSFYGGLLGGLLAGAAYCRITGLDFRTVSDVLAAPLALAYGIARIGCFLNGCCYGRETALPIGVVFPGVVGARIPTQLFSSFAGFAIFFLLRAAERRQRFSGQLFCEFLTYYSVYRFVIEFFREGKLLWGPFDVTQPLALAGVILFGALTLRGLRGARSVAKIGA